MARPGPHPELFAASSESRGLVLSPNELPDSHPVKTIELPADSNLIASVVLSVTNRLLIEMSKSPRVGTHIVKGVLRGKVEKTGMVEMVVVDERDLSKLGGKKLLSVIKRLRARHASSPALPPPDPTRGRDLPPTRKDAMSEKTHRETDGDLLAGNKVGELAARARARISAELLRLHEAGVIDDEGEARSADVPIDMMPASVTDF
jgi:hypothetical protein